MVDFIKELADYCYTNNLLNNCTRLHAKEIYKIAEKHHKVAELIYLMQFNYESCETAKDYAFRLMDNLL